VAEVEEKLPKGKQVILLCESGGSLQNKSGTKVQHRLCACLRGVALRAWVLCADA
jgi:hypothetical protein